MNPAVKEMLERYWGIAALLVWGGLLLTLGLISLQPYGIDENAARGLLLNWTVADNVINPIVVFGVPDFRALLYVPIGAYWPGSMLAAKIMSIVIAFLAVALLYRWCRNTADSEAALIGGTLLLLSPVLLNQVDSLGAGPYMLLGFAAAAWLDKAYRAKPRYFGGWYFSQMMWVAILITIHPLAIAYPLALAWHWWRHPDPHKQSRHVYIGIVVAVVVAMALKQGWDNVAWLSNPFMALSQALDGSIIWSIEDINWAPGIILGVLLLATIIADFRFLTKNLLGLLLLSSTIIGLLAADGAWATLVLVLVLFRGTYLLIRLNQSAGKQSFAGQRGLVAVSAFVCATFFMLQAKDHHYVILAEALSAEDELIYQLAEEAADESQPFRAASQWPARTMLATRRDALPLPPPIDNQEQFLAALRGVSHVIFNPFDPSNKALADRIADVGDKTETLAYMKAGVIVYVRDHNVELQHYRPPVDETPDEMTENDNRNTQTK